MLGQQNIKITNVCFLTSIFIASVNVDVFEKDEIFWYSLCRSYQRSSSTLHLQAASNLTAAILSVIIVTSLSQSELNAY